jgi:hypothetical protein
MSNRHAKQRRFPPLTPGVRAAIDRGIAEARAEKTRAIELRHVLLGILDFGGKDRAAELLAALGVDGTEVRERLKGSAT